jgi:hypothetical protein
LRRWNSTGFCMMKYISKNLKVKSKGSRVIYRGYRARPDAPLV